MCGLIEHMERHERAATPPEADATPDEAFELGKVAGYDEGRKQALIDARAAVAAVAKFRVQERTDYGYKEFSAVHREDALAAIDNLKGTEQ